MENRDRGALKVQVRQRYELRAPYLNEQLRRAWAAAEALTLGRGGNAIVAEAIGISRTTLTKAKHEVLSPIAVPSRPRQPGGGRKLLAETAEGLLDALDALIDPRTRGAPESPLRWTCKSTSQLAAALSAQGQPISQRTVYRLLEALGSSLQANRKTQAGADHPDRDAQFLFIYRHVRRSQRKKLPVLAVDTKQKEKLGNCAQRGREGEPPGRPTQGQTSDLPDPHRGPARPYGIDDLTRTEGWGNVGISRDPAQFAVESLRRWWHQRGQERYPQAPELLITAAGGGSNGDRTRLGKAELHRLANELHRAIRGCHFPPGTSKGNKMAQRMFSFIRKNWRGRPLDSLATVVNLIASTTTDKGLSIETSIADTIYETGSEVSDDEFAAVNITREKFHGEWNYVIKPLKIK